MEDTTETQQLANAISASINANGCASTTGGSQQISGSLAGYNQQVLGYTYQQPYYYYWPSSSLDRDEELLLNAVRRNPEIKRKALKMALAELLKDLDKAPKVKTNA